MIRRDWLKLLLGLSSWLPVQVILAATGSTPSSFQESLAPYLDIILPPGDSPSATDLGTDKWIIEEADRNTELAQLIQAGCNWLDLQAQRMGAGDFGSLGISDRERIVTTMETAPSRSLPKVFFRSLQDFAFRHYYSQPESWLALGYQGPPQPTGFPGHDRAPTDTA